MGHPVPEDEKSASGQSARHCYLKCVRRCAQTCAKQLQKTSRSSREEMANGQALGSRMPGLTGDIVMDVANEFANASLTASEDYRVWDVVTHMQQESKAREGGRKYATGTNETIKDPEYAAQKKKEAGSAVVGTERNAWIGD